MKKIETKFYLEDTIVWVALCGLTLLSYFQYEGLENGTSRAGILVIALVKFSLVFMVFMKMKKAHVLWKVLAVAYLAMVSLLFLIF